MRSSTTSKLFLGVTIFILSNCGTNTSSKKTNPVITDNKVAATQSDSENYAQYKGAKGDTGAQGVQGSNGVKGDKGDKGDPGFIADFYCSAGQVLVGIQNGMPKCQDQIQYQPTKVVTRVQSCAVTFNPAPNNSWGCLASCNSDEILSGGGFNKSAANTTGGAYSMPSGNGWFCNIGNITSCSSGSAPCGSTCYAVCLRVEK